MVDPRYGGPSLWRPFAMGDLRYGRPSLWGTFAMAALRYGGPQSSLLQDIYICQLY